MQTAISPGPPPPTPLPTCLLLGSVLRAQKVPTVCFLLSTYVDACCCVIAAGRGETGCFHSNTVVLQSSEINFPVEMFLN